MRVSVVSLSALIAVIGSAALAASCSSPSHSANNDGGSSSGSSSGGEDSAPPACAQFTDDAGLAAPTVSFKNDVLPMFEFSCGISSSCHGGDPAMSIQLRGLFLGCSAMSVDAGTCSATGDPVAQVYAGLVGASANVPIEESCMPFVTPGDPTKSYLMHKLDGDQCILGCCTADNTAVKMVATGALSGSGWCGTFMPYQVMLLPSGKVCGGSTDCTVPGNFNRDTVRAWIQQGAMNN